MAYTIWKGPNGRASAPKGGDFLTAANWSTGTAPGATTDVLLGPGHYTVTVSRSAALVRSFDLGTGVTLDIQGGNSGSLSVQGSGVSYGTIRLIGGYLGATGEFVNFGVIQGQGSDAYGGQIGSGTIINEGLISTIAETGPPGMAITTVFRNDAGGVVSTGAGGAIYLLGTTTNTGLIEAAHGGTVTTSGFGWTGTVTNLSGTALIGGHWAATGAGATVWLPGATISKLSGGAVVTLAGAGSSFRVDDGSGAAAYLEQTLDRVDAGAALQVLGGRDYTTSEKLAVKGMFQLGGGVLSAGDLRGETGSTISGFGTIATLATFDGAVRADMNPADRSDTLEFTTFTDFNGRVSGQGTLELSGGRDTFTTSQVTVKTLLLDGADVEIDRSFRYRGHLTMTTGILDLKDSTLTLAGETTLSGGRIAGGGKLVVSGDLTVHAGDAVFDVGSIRNDGGIAVDHGSLTVNGTVTGRGGFTVGAQGTLILDDASHLTAASPVMTLDGAGATLRFDGLANPQARVAGFGSSERIDFSTLQSAGTNLFWRADDDGSGGTLLLSNGTQTASVHLEENHAKRDFAFASDGASGTVVTLKGAAKGAAPAAAFHAVDPGAFGHDRADLGGHSFGGHVSDLGIHAALV